MDLRQRLGGRGRGIHSCSKEFSLGPIANRPQVTNLHHIYCCCCSAAWRSVSGSSWRTEDQSSDSISVSGGGGLSDGATRTATVNSLEALPLKTPRVGGTSA